MFLLVISMVNAEPQSSTMFSSSIDVSEGCKSAIQRLSTLQATEPQLVARYWDSWGKPSDSLLTGHTTFLGYYDECIHLKYTELGEMSYCIYPMKMNTNILQTPSASQDGVCQSSDCPMAVNTSTTLNVKVAVCYPSACSANEFSLVLSNMNITSVTMARYDPFSNTTNTITINLNVIQNAPLFCSIKGECDAGIIVLIILCLVLILLVVIGTTVDVVYSLHTSNRGPTEVDKKSNKNNSAESVTTATNYLTAKDFILAFSLYTTIPNILAAPSPSALKALSAIKVFSNLIVIALHAHVFNTLIFSAVSHNSYLSHLPSRLIFQPVINVTFALESFFVASGTLSAYLTFKDMEKHKKFRFKYIYLNRFFRLSILFYFFTFVYHKLATNFRQGPLWFTYDPKTCGDSWFYNVLYITNTRSVTEQCLPTAWHVAADMQLFVFSPVFIILLYHIWYAGVAAVVITMIAATATIGYVSATNGYWAAMLYNPKYLEQTDGLHIQTFYRINSYLTGILLGYVLYKKHYIATMPIRNCTKWLIYTLLWTVGITLCLTTMFGTYGEYGFIYHFSELENVIYLMFSGLGWSIGIAIIIYVCNSGYGGMIGSFLCWPGWEPLVKLTYAVSLCHAIIWFNIVGSFQFGLKYTDTVFAMILVFTIVYSYSFAAIIAVFVEQPLLRVVSLSFKSVGIETRSK